MITWAQNGTQHYSYAASQHQSVLSLFYDKLQPPSSLLSLSSLPQQSQAPEIWLSLSIEIQLEKEITNYFSHWFISAILSEFNLVAFDRNEINCSKSIPHRNCEYIYYFFSLLRNSYRIKLTAQIEIDNRIFLAAGLIIDLTTTSAFQYRNENFMWKCQRFLAFEHFAQNTRWGGCDDLNWLFEIEQTILHITQRNYSLWTLIHEYNIERCCADVAKSFELLS